MSKNKSTQKPVKQSNICQNLIKSVPRCLCGATVANCIIDNCEKALKNDKNAKITIEEWKKACILQSPYCNNFNFNESCNIQFYDQK